MDLKGRIVVFSIIGCPHCLKAKNTLQEHGLAYNDVNLEIYPQCRDYVKQKTGKHTVPQVFFNGIHIGGNDELQRAIGDTNRWRDLLDEIQNNSPGPDAPNLPDPDTAVKEGSSEFTCEPDEYARMVQDLKESGIIHNHRSGLSYLKNTFTGVDFVNWVVKQKQIDTEEAIEMGQALIDNHFGHDVKQQEGFKNDSTLYRLIEDDDTAALNKGALSECQPRSANALGEEIRRLILKLYAAFLSVDGKKVDYEGIAGSQEFEHYKKLATELIRVNISECSREEKLAFFINIYNALVIHGNIDKGPPVNLWQRYKFFNTVRYIIGGQVYSLQDIENGVLRGNRKGVGQFFSPFGKNDPRLKVALSEPEPLIHFALVCGAKSCPPIKTYSADGVMVQLKMASEAFLDSDDGVWVDMTKKEIKLSMIFKWYRVDFGDNNDQVVDWVLHEMAEGDKKNQLAELVSSKKARISHLTYDWGANSK